MHLIDQILTLSDAYQAATGAKPTTISWRVFGDGKKLDAIRGGSDLQTKRFETAIAWFADNWPENTPWPKCVCRPKTACVQR